MSRDEQLIQWADALKFAAESIRKSANRRKMDRALQYETVREAMRILGKMQMHVRSRKRIEEQ